MVQCVHYLLFSYIDCKLSLTHSLWNLTPIFSPLFFVYTQHSFASMIYRKCLRVRRDFMLYAHHYLSQCYRSLLRATSLKWNEMKWDFTAPRTLRTHCENDFGKCVCVRLLYDVRTLCGIFEKRKPKYGEWNALCVCIQTRSEPKC